MKIFRVRYGEDDYTSIETYHLSFESARDAMVHYAQTDRKYGDPYWKYTWRWVECMDICDGKKSTEEDWENVLDCKDMTDRFPAPAMNRDGTYADEDDYYEDEDDDCED